MARKKIKFKANKTDEKELEEFREHIKIMNDKTKAISEKYKALLTLNLLSEHPAGIGDHSTEDFYKNANEALVMLVDANDKIAVLQKYFPKSKNAVNG